MANRKAAQEVILKWIDELLPGSENTRLYQELFAQMSDKAFDELMRGIEDGTKRLAIIAPNLGKYKLSIERNFTVAKKLGHEFFQRIRIDRGDGTPPYYSAVPYLIVDLPLRRQAQLLVKKISIPEDNRSVDDYTGQPTGKSKGSKISYPETQIMAANNLDHSLVEMLKYRGGDVKGFDAMNTMIAKTGGVSLKAIEKLGTTVKSTQTLSTFLTCMHLENTLVK
jgi:hypothetical protein